MRKAINHTYRTITGRSLDLRRLEQEERPFIAHVLESFKNGVEWSKFAALWMREFERRSLDPEGMAYRLCQDLEARLGIAQGKVSPPDYRDYLADLIDEKYGSRYKFCKETGIDAGHLSRVFASRSDLSLEALTKLLSVLGAVLIIQPEDDLKAHTSPEEASRALAGVA
jgi:hypothetical protein